MEYTMELKIYHMYPDLLNLYGDLGNVTCLRQRCEWRGIKAEVVEFNIANEAPLEDGDLFVIGGGSDRSQKIVYSHLLKYSNQMGELIEDGVPVLAVCGGYQLLGEKYIDAKGNDLPGLGIFDYHTRSEEGRMIGNIIIRNSLGLEPETLVGFENHGGCTYHDYQALGKVVVGYGNNGKDQKEGMIYQNCIGTYLHGPLLPKNPQLADHLILEALKRKYALDKLPCLEDNWEYAAHNKVLKLYSP